MEKKWRERVSKPPQCQYPNHPSFSSTLLDSIYRSIDDENPAGRFIPPINPPVLPRSLPNHKTAATSSSSGASSYSGFSSSDSSKRSKKERLGSIRTRFLRELRKNRDPVSPAARLANFLNSLFAVKVKARDDSSCSSGSCMRKTPSVRGKLGAEKRSVRFYPTSLMADESTGRRAEEEEEEWDAGSDSSSDLFELENLAVVGRFRDELPVYETTRLESCGGINRFYD